MKQLNKTLFDYEINTPQRIQHFMAQIAVESDYGKYREEAEWLDKESQEAYLQYLEGRVDLGNTEPGDGLKYRGAGYKQVTGKYNYQQLANRVGDQKIMEGYKYLKEEYPWVSAGDFWESKKSNEKVDNGSSVKDITKIINGGTNGLAKRESAYELAKTIFK